MQQIHHANTHPGRWQDEEGQCLYDVIVVARRDTLSASIKAIREKCPCTPLIYDTVDLHFVREARAVLSENNTKLNWTFNSVNVTWLTNWIDSSSQEADHILRCAHCIARRDSVLLWCWCTLWIMQFC